MTAGYQDKLFKQNCNYILEKNFITIFWKKIKVNFTEKISKSITQEWEDDDDCFFFLNCHCICNDSLYF